jgi:putative hydrolase of HD superfamily
VGIIGWFLAKMEGADPYKVTMMCLFHDIAEARSGDHNWVHKKYVKIFEEEILEDQFGLLPQAEELHSFTKEYRKRESRESKIAKDADLIDQILLLKEYIHQGNKEAAKWLIGKKDDKKIFSQSAQDLAKEICAQEPGEWWQDIWTDKNR